MEQALQEDDHVIATTKPVYSGNKLRIERCRAAGQFSESVLDEPTCDLSVLIRIALIQDQILEVKENQHHHQRRHSCDNGDNYGIFGGLTQVINMRCIHCRETCRSLLISNRAAAGRITVLYEGMDWGSKSFGPDIPTLAPIKEQPLSILERVMGRPLCIHMAYNAVEVVGC